MSQPKQPIWGVKGLNEAEQRDVRGGALANNRAQCIRSAIQSYSQARRNNSDTRGSLLNQLLFQIANANCSSGFQGSGSA